MSYLRQRAPGNSRATYVSIGVRGAEAAQIVDDARAYARALGVTLGSLVMEALCQYMAFCSAETRRKAAEARDNE